MNQKHLNPKLIGALVSDLKCISRLDLVLADKALVNLLHLEKSLLHNSLLAEKHKEAIHFNQIFLFLIGWD